MHHQGCCSIWDICPKHILNSNFAKIPSFKTSIWIFESSWHLAQGTEVSLSCTKQNFLNDWTTEWDVMDERDFARFQFKMSFGLISYFAHRPGWQEWMDSKWQTLQDWSLRSIYSAAADSRHERLLSTMGDALNSFPREMPARGTHVHMLCSISEWHLSLIVMLNFSFYFSAHYTYPCAARERTPK